MHIHFDLMGGIAGDMFLAAAIDAGLVELSELEKGLRSVGLGTKIRIVHEKVWRGAMSALHVHFEDWDPEAESDHRHLSTILEMIAQSSFDEEVKQSASTLFKTLGESEAKVHGISLEKVHFHEVGAVDSILDFLSAAWIIHHVNATWSIGEIPFGKGTIQTAHGEIPLPAPATADLLKGFELTQKNIWSELITPTGAAILKMVKPVQTELSIKGRLKAIGYGAGTKDIPDVSNVVRLMIFENTEKSENTEFDYIMSLETEIDDMNPEILSHVCEMLLEQGALDVIQESVQMKKGRVGLRIRVLCTKENEATLIETLFLHTSTFGIRKNLVERVKLKREVQSFETKFGQIHVKVGYWGKEIIKQSPEFEDCKRAALAHGVPILEVYDEVGRISRRKEKNV